MPARAFAPVVFPHVVLSYRLLEQVVMESGSGDFSGEASTRHNQ